MNGNAEVCLTLTEGPICGLGGAGINTSYALWDSIIATESFPSGAGAAGANYVLTLKKAVHLASEVRLVKDELAKALQLLAAAWPFAGGSYITIATREVVCSVRVESNAESLERDMLAQCGRMPVQSKNVMPLGWSATYKQAPLCLAVRIAQTMHSDFPTGRLLHYHQRAVIERRHPSNADEAYWFISLYKVRDFLCKFHGGERAAKKALKITGGWSRFGNLLNNHDLRHAEITGKAPQISGEEIDELYILAHCWVASYLREDKNLTVCG